MINFIKKHVFTIFLSAVAGVWHFKSVSSWLKAGDMAGMNVWIVDYPILLVFSKISFLSEFFEAEYEIFEITLLILGTIMYVLIGLMIGLIVEACVRGVMRKLKSS